MFPIPVEPHKGLDVAGEWKEVEDFDAAETHPPASHEHGQLFEKTRQPTGEVDEPPRRGGGESGEQRRVESLARRVDDDDVRARESVEPLARRALEARGPRPLRFRPRREATGESGESGGAPLVEAYRSALQQAEADRAHAAVGLEDGLASGHE